jgi:hypothetical protein
MKKLMILVLLLGNYPISASVNCLDNSKHLSEDFDDKEWHSVACDCPCTVIKGNKCIECGHLQNASTYVVVLPTKVAHQEKISAPAHPQAVIKKLALKYLQKK